MGYCLGYALIVAIDAENVGIEGTGTIDGQGQAPAAKQKPYTMRPFLIRWVRCSNVSVKDVHLANPGAWTLNFFQAKGAVVEGVTIRCRDQKLRNNDGERRTARHARDAKYSRGRYERTEDSGFPHG